MENVYHGFRFHQLLSLPRATANPDLGAIGSGAARHAQAATFAALTAAHARLAGQLVGPPPALSVAWVRSTPGGPLRFLMGGRPYFPPAGGAEPVGGHGRVAYPRGARVISLPEREVADMLDALPYWVRCVGAPDVLWTQTLLTSRPVGGPRPILDTVATYIDTPFAWLVIAEPVPREVLDWAGPDPADLFVPLARTDHAVMEREAERRRALARSRATGMWDVRILVGAADPATAHAAAGLLCGAADVTDQPFLLTPTRGVSDLAGSWAAPEDRLPDPVSGGTWPFTATTEFLGALARPPVLETAGLHMFPPNTFGLTYPELDDGAFLIGDALDETQTPMGPMRVSRSTLNRHTFVCGATGSGKSQTVRSLLGELSTHPQPVPWLVIEPVKAEYARMAGRLGPDHRVTVIRPGDPDTAPAGLNPLEPEPGFPLQSHMDLARALFMAAFDTHEPLPQVLARAMSQCYRDSGWDVVGGEQRPPYKPKFLVDDPDVPRAARYPTLDDLRTAAIDVVRTIGYGSEVSRNVRGFVDVRIAGLREGACGRFFQGGHPLDIAALLEGNVVLQLENISNDQDKAFVIGTVLIRIVEHLRVRTDSAVPGRLRHVTVVEEAHRLLRAGGNRISLAAAELFAGLLAEIRAYGEGVVVVEQIPNKILSDVVKNSALKIIHRLPAADDRAMVGDAVNLQGTQHERVVALPPGHAAVATDGMDVPVLVAMPYGEGSESEDGVATDPPLRGRRSVLCGTACAEQPCTLRVMSHCAHTAGDPELVLWTEANAAVIVTMGDSLRPGEPLLRRLRDLDDRELHCTLVYAAERATAARVDVMSGEIDPDDFAGRLVAVLAHRSDRGPEPQAVDPRALTYGTFRWQDINDALEAAKEADPSTPWQHPDSAEWARRGLRLTSATPAGQLQELWQKPYYWSGSKISRYGDPFRSGLRDAVATVAGAVNAAAIKRAFRIACADTPERKRFLNWTTTKLAERLQADA